MGLLRTRSQARESSTSQKEPAIGDGAQSGMKHQQSKSIRGGVIPCRMAVALGAIFDGAGLSETASTRRRDDRRRDDGNRAGAFTAGPKLAAAAIASLSYKSAFSSRLCLAGPIAAGAECCGAVASVRVLSKRATALGIPGRHLRTAPYSV
jgi:hypothetical protein